MHKLSGLLPLHEPVSVGPQGSINQNAILFIQEQAFESVTDFKNVTHIIQASVFKAIYKCAALRNNPWHQMASTSHDESIYIRSHLWSGLKYTYCPITKVYYLSQVMISTKNLFRRAQYG